MAKTNYEARFYVALKRITAYMTPSQLRRNAEREYGLDHAEALEMAYENVIEEARSALRGYRKPRAGTVPALSHHSVTPSASAAPEKKPSVAGAVGP
jgi:hypothetical protein